MKQYANSSSTRSAQYMIQENTVPGFHVFQARVKVKSPLYSNSMDVAIFAKNPQMARQLLMAQYGKDSIITNVVQVA